MPKKCKHGIELKPAKYAIPPRMEGCVICHNLPSTAHCWHPYAWPLTEYTKKEIEQMLVDIETLLQQREEFRNAAGKCE